MQHLAEVIEKGIFQYQPNHGQTGANTLFRGSYDWHSCVMGWWSLLTIARFTDGNVDAVRSKIDEASLLKEVVFLRANPEFELPYGRGWLFNLLGELKYSGLEAFRLDLGNELEHWLECSPFPEQEGVILGTHKSWLCCLLFVTMGRLSAGESLENISLISRFKLEPLRAGLETYNQRKDGIEWDFIDRAALLAVIDLLSGRNLSTDQLAYLAKNRDEFLQADLPTLAREQAHVPGRWAMLSWPFALLDSAGESFELITEKILKYEECWNGNFHWFSHWVPQYIWIGSYLRHSRQNIAAIIQT